MMPSRNTVVQHNTVVQPVPWWNAVLIFAIPGLVIDLAVHHLVPFGVERGMPLAIAWTVAVVGPIVINAIVVLLYYVRSERPTWVQFIVRFRLQPPSPHTLWLVPLAMVAIVLGNELLAWTVPYMKQIPGFAPPALTPEIFSDVYESLDQGLANRTFMGQPLSTDPWWLVPFWILCWSLLAVMAEEVVWRGYVLPGQELRYGAYAWVVNGLLWNLPFHLYTIHNVFSDMPLYWILPLVVQRTRNTWIGILLHGILVSLALLILLPGLLVDR